MCGVWRDGDIGQTSSSRGTEERRLWMGQGQPRGSARLGWDPTQGICILGNWCSEQEPEVGKELGVGPGQH